MATPVKQKKTTWEKKAMGVFSSTKRPHPGNTPASQMPAYTDPVELDVGGYSLVYHNGLWKGELLFSVPRLFLSLLRRPPGEGQGFAEADEVERLKQVIARLQDENQRVLEENCMLDFKVQLLTDMVCY
eukprot:m51a1_g7439 hypothetical protein (129) ;mRNA; r:76699-77136